jgi:glycosyltransferase involved in cell wall biosynthesis
MMKRFGIPTWLSQHCVGYHPDSPEGNAVLDRVRDGLARFQADDPEVTIAIPVFNEEANLVQTLSSLAALETNLRVQLLVVNNNSTDRTQEILDRCGVKSYFESRQGISYARQTALEHAKGTYYLSADADSIYPATWVDTFVTALKDPTVHCVYGRYSFIPSKKSSRFWLALYELTAESFFLFRRQKRDYLNVMGFNFAFRRTDGLAVGGFNISRQRWQDGWMALQLGKRGTIKLDRSWRSRVWTSDRRLIADGNLRMAFFRRFRTHSAKLRRYLRDDARQPESQRH